MIINWIKASEIALEALLTGIISGLVVYISYLLGKRQSDINWKREIEHREKERNDIEQKEYLKRRLSIIDELLTCKELIITRLTKPIYRYSEITWLDNNEIARILHILRRAQGIYQNVNDECIHEAIEKLIEMTDWNNARKNLNPVENEQILLNIFVTFEKEYKELENELN